VREALVQLQREVGRRNYRIRAPSSSNWRTAKVAELCELRLILETNALQLAMRRQSWALDREIDGGCHARGAQEKLIPHTAILMLISSSLLQHSRQTLILRTAMRIIEATISTPAVSLQTASQRITILPGRASSNRQSAWDSQRGCGLSILTRHIKRARELMGSLNEVTPV